jgi:hypothetical protein
MPKCYKCKEKSEKDVMVCIESGKEKITRKYFHYDCHTEFLQQQESKQLDLKQWDELYHYLKNLHSLEVLDGRMIEKVQDLRNGTVKLNGKKVPKYKQGITYLTMLETYKFIEQRIDYIKNSTQFQTKWNEFSYIFGTMINNINTIKEMERHKNLSEKLNTNIKVNQETVAIEVKKSVKKDDLDISEFL